ncbi:MAG: leucine-rich repeat domain-containing protein, partial [Prevotellaceae bacterium]|nr:leucine-rich repeat domain-containing protein [Prevotellaceae bacterium]
MKRILVILTALIGLGFSANAQAIIDKGTCGDNLTWILTGTDNNLTLTISGTGTMTNYVYYGNRSPWTSHGRNIATVVTNNGVATIGEYAFLFCENLTSVSIPNSVTSIGGSAFMYCRSLTSINIPNSVTSIGGSAFSGCSSLTSINIAEYNRYYSSDNGVLFNKNKTVLIFYPQGKSGDYTIPTSVTEIGKYAFYSCSSLKSVNIPNSVT